MSKSLVVPEDLPFVTRREWAALRPLSQTPLKMPLTHVQVHQSGGKECSDRDSCSTRLRKLQYDHCYHHGFHDIGYNFMVSTDGTVYEGRGWHFEVNRDDEKPELKERCLDIAYVGNYKKKPPSGRSVDSVNALINHGVEIGYIIPNYTFINYDEHEEPEITFDE